MSTVDLSELMIDKLTNLKKRIEQSNKEKNIDTSTWTKKIVFTYPKIEDIKKLNVEPRPNS